MKQIVSPENARFKALRKLAQSGRERRKTGLTLADGLHLLQAYVEHHGSPESILVAESALRIGEIAAFLAEPPASSELIVLADALFAELASVETPSGLMAVIRRPSVAHRLDQECDTLILDGVQDPGNVGSMLRSAAAAGFRQVLLSHDCAAAWAPKTLRAGMGAHFQLDLHEHADLCGFLGGYRGTALATTLEAATDLYDQPLDGPLAWVFGSEGQGVRPELIALAGGRVRIPMPGGTESLNVAAAAAVCLFEMVRQRRNAQPAARRG